MYSQFMMHGQKNIKLFQEAFSWHKNAPNNSETRRQYIDMFHVILGIVECVVFPVGQTMNVKYCTNEIQTSNVKIFRAEIAT